MDEALEFQKVVLQRRSRQQQRGGGAHAAHGLRHQARVVLHALRLVQHEVRIIQSAKPLPMGLLLGGVALKERVARDDYVESATPRGGSTVPARPRPRVRPVARLRLRGGAVEETHAERWRPSLELPPPVFQQRSGRHDQRARTPRACGGGGPSAHAAGFAVATVGEVGDGLRRLAEAHSLEMARDALLVRRGGS